jgi:hypothetical protein
MKRLAALTTAALLATTGIAYAQHNEEVGPPEGHKVTICHHTSSETNPTVTITVDEHSWPAHQRHGDTVGACPARPASPGGPPAPGPGEPTPQVEVGGPAAPGTTSAPPAGAVDAEAQLTG